MVEIIPPAFNNRACDGQGGSTRLEGTHMHPDQRRDVVLDPMDTVGGSTPSPERLRGLDLGWGEEHQSGEVLADVDKDVRLTGGDEQGVPGLDRYRS